MSWLKRALPAAAWAAVFVSSPATAQMGGHPIEVSGGAGIVAFDTRARLQDAPGFTGSVGYRLAPWFTLEASALMASSKADTLPEPDATFLHGSLDMRFNVRPEITAFTLVK